MIIEIARYVRIGVRGGDLRYERAARTTENGDPLYASLRRRDEPSLETEPFGDVCTEFVRGEFFGQISDPPVSALFRESLDGVYVVRHLLVWMALGGGANRFVREVGRDDGFEAYFGDFFEVSPRPRIWIRRVSGEEGSVSFGSERAMRIVADDPGSRTGERVGDRLHVLFRDEDDELFQGASRGDDGERAAKPEGIGEVDGDAFWGAVVARVGGVYGGAAFYGAGEYVSRIKTLVHGFQRFEDEWVVEEDEVRVLLFRFVEDFGERGEGEEDALHFRVRVSGLEGGVVPRFGEGGWGEGFYFLDNLSK